MKLRISKDNKKLKLRFLPLLPIPLEISNESHANYCMKNKLTGNEKIMRQSHSNMWILARPIKYSLVSQGRLHFNNFWQLTWRVRIWMPVVRTWKLKSNDQDKPWNSVAQIFCQGVKGRGEISIGVSIRVKLSGAVTKYSAVFFWLFFT